MKKINKNVDKIKSPNGRVTERKNKKKKSRFSTELLPADFEAKPITTFGDFQKKKICINIELYPFLI